jgi:hypothetical protein
MGDHVFDHSLVLVFSSGQLNLLGDHVSEFVELSPQLLALLIIVMGVQEIAVVEQGLLGHVRYVRVV